MLLMKFSLMPIKEKCTINMVRKLLWVEMPQVLEVWVIYLVNFSVEVVVTPDNKLPVKLRLEVLKWRLPSKKPTKEAWKKYRLAEKDHVPNVMVKEEKMPKHVPPVKERRWWLKWSCSAPACIHKAPNHALIAEDRVSCMMNKIDAKLAKDRQSSMKNKK
jgi:hypothetical protein